MQSPLGTTFGAPERGRSDAPRGNRWCPTANARPGAAQKSYRLGYVCLDIFELLPTFPDFNVALVVLDGLTIQPECSPQLEALVSTVEAEVTHSLDGNAVSDLEEIQAWRGTYRSFGVKKTSYRCSVERLLRGLERGRGLPRVNCLVDCYNAVSVRHRMPVGADDLDQVRGGLSFRYARQSDSFYALGAVPPEDDPPKQGEVVYADQEKLLCRRWNWYQDSRSAIGLQTRRAVLTIQSIGRSEDLRKAAQELSAWCVIHFGARTAWAIADQSKPRISLDLPKV